MNITGFRAAGLTLAFLFFTGVALSAQDGATITHNGHAYTAFEDGVSWEDARRACEEKGGHLATITSRAEQKAIRTMLKSAGKKFYWIGGYRSRSSFFKWITEEKFSFTNWASGAPGDGALGKDDALMLYKSGGAWKDENGDKPAGKASNLEKYGYICEWEDSDDAVSFADDSAYEDYDEDEDFSDDKAEDVGISIPVGKKVHLFGPSGAKWSSSNPNVAKVTKNGVVMAVSKGTAVISVKGAGDVTVRVEE